MTTRHTSYSLIVVVVSALALAPWRGAAWPQETDLEPIPVQGRLSPDGESIKNLGVVYQSGVE